jgi:hypothetical protein
VETDGTQEDECGRPGIDFGILKLFEKAVHGQCTRNSKRIRENMLVIAESHQKYKGPKHKTAVTSRKQGLMRVNNNNNNNNNNNKG